MATSALSAYLPTLRNVLKWLASTLAVSLTVGGTALYLLQSRLIYPANLPAGSRQDVPRPEEFGMPGEEVELTAPDGVKLKAFVIKAPGDPSLRPTVLLLHANAGNVVSSCFRPGRSKGELETVTTYAPLARATASRSPKSSGTRCAAMSLHCPTEGERAVCLAELDTHH